MARRDKVTIADIARHVGLTNMTVSRALNKPDKVKPATRERILAAARELGYVPNAFASHLRSRENRLIGLVTASVDNPFYSEVIKAISRDAKKQNYTIMLIDTDGAPELEEVAIETLLSYQVAGIILSPVSDDAEYRPAYLDRLRRARLPVVMLDRTLDVADFSRVVLDNHRAGRLLGEQLVKQDIQQVLALTGPRGSRITQQRLAGLKEAYAAAGVPLALEQRPGDYTLQPAYRDMADYLRHGMLPEAVFGFNQLITLGAMRALHDAHVSRDDVLVVGIDRLPYADIFDVSVWCAVHDTYQAGHEAIQLLFEKINDPAASAREVVIASSLIR
ncbi:MULTISPECIES: LacI family DNA-binding transcriptional regulator [Halomonas]|uniref:LacI family transcriptional regulator n=1 Tax=Halomonas flagellata TaxID=2920385 RepID=A0ABS9RWB0_9GAMM|nr:MULTISPECIES: LacI family DNA-binding transcriptional regulator [Halomonas]MCH4564106.1 LacI family transcriptional regulator [Halomonas flagellata]PXX98516.1 LacI family transcriptional regulator [Halomonas sp. LBP4]